MKSTLTRCFWLVSVCSLILAGCGHEAVNTKNSTTSGFHTTPVDLPVGPHYLAYDSSGDAIWILSWQASEDRALLTRFDVTSGSVATVPLSQSTEGLGNAGAVTVGPDSTVWLAWGTNLVHYDPATKTSRSWPLPDASAFLERRDSGSDGQAVSVTTGGTHVYVASSGIGAIEEFDTQANTWRLISTGLLVGMIRTRVASVGPSTVVMNGTMKGTNTPTGVATPGLVEVRNGSPVLSSVRVVSFAVRSDASILYADDAGNIGTLDTANAAPARTFASGYTALPRNVNAFLASGNDSWLWTPSSTGVDFTRLADDGTKAQYQFLFKRATVGSNNLANGPQGAPRPTPGTSYMIGAGVEEFVVDKHGDLWLSLRNVAPPYYTALMGLTAH